MKLSRLSVLLSITLLFSFQVVFADTVELSWKSITDRGIENSVDLRVNDSKVEKLTKQYYQTLKVASLADDFLDMDEEFRELRNKTNRTPEEAAKLAVYQQMLGEGLSTEDRYEYLKMKEIIPLNMAYSIFMNKQMRDVNKNSVVIAASEAYGSLLKSKELVDLQQKLVINLDKNYSAAQKRYSQGKISRNDFIYLEKDLKKAKLQLSQYQRNLTSSLIKVNQMIGAPAMSTYSNYSKVGIAFNKTSKTYEQYLQQALSSRFEILNASEYLKLKTTEFQVTKQCYSWEKDLPYMEAKYGLEDAEIKLEEAKINIEREVYSCYKELENKFSTNQRLQQLYNIDLTNYNSALKKYGMGLITEKQLSDANTSLYNSQIQLRNSEIDLWRYQLKLEYAAGIGPGIASR